MQTKTKNLIKNILTPVLGFGLGGLLWGLEAYRGAGGAGESPFSFILGALSLGIFGSVSLVIFSKDLKKILKIAGLGIIGCLVGFLLPAIGAYWLLMLGGILQPIIALFFYLTKVDLTIIFSGLNGLLVGALWLHFLFTGAIIAFFYSLILRIKKWPMLWRAGIGFALASLISPIIGNLFSNLLASYLVTFSLLSIILGLFLKWGISKAKQ